MGGSSIKDCGSKKEGGCIKLSWFAMEDGYIHQCIYKEVTLLARADLLRGRWFKLCRSAMELERWKKRSSIKQFGSAVEDGCTRKLIIRGGGGCVEVKGGSPASEQGRTLD